MPLSPALQGLLWMTACTVCFSAMTVSVRFLADTIPPFEQVFLRSVISLALALPTLYPIRHQAAQSFRANRIGRLYITRGFCTFTGVSCWFFAIAALPLAEAVALHFTLPIFGLILSALILKEKVWGARWGAVAAGFVGVLLILKPGVAAIDVMAFVVLISALGYAGGDICTKLLSKTEPSRLIVLNLNIYLILFSAIPTVLIWRTPPASDIPMILLMGSSAYAAHLCLAQALKAAEASVVIPMEFLRLPLTALAAYVFFAEVPGALTIVGAAVIFFGTWQMTVREHRR